MKCFSSGTEKREDSVQQAARLLGDGGDSSSSPTSRTTTFGKGSTCKN